MQKTTIPNIFDLQTSERQKKRLIYDVNKCVQRRFAGLDPRPTLLIFDIDGTIVQNKIPEYRLRTDIIQDTFDVTLLSDHLKDHLLTANIQVAFASYNTDFSEVYPLHIQRRYCGNQLAKMLMEHWVLSAFKNMVVDHAIHVANDHVSGGFLQAWRPADKNSFQALPGKNIHILRIFEAYKTKYGAYPSTKHVYFYDDDPHNIAHAKQLGINTFHVNRSIGVEKHLLPKVK